MTFSAKKSIIVCMLLLIVLQLFGQTTIKPGAVITAVHTGNAWYEGPAWDQATGKLYFTTPNDYPYNVYRLDAPGQASVWYPGSSRINGMFIDNSGRLLTCEQGSQRICSYRIGLSGPEDQQIVASDGSWYYPNDICQRAQGDIYFTCPNWENRPQGAYRLSTSGAVTRIAADLNQPNGIITSIDGTTLYIADSNLLYWKSYPVNADGSVGSGSVFFNPSTSNRNSPDGMTIDEQGNLYFTGRGGLWIVSPGGVQLDFISVPEATSNVCFGGSGGTILYITGQDKVYSLETTVRGASFAGGTPIPTSGPTTAPGLRGDANGNGAVDIIDALLTAQYYVGLDPQGFLAANADTNCNGAVDIVDALLMAQFYVGLITQFC